MPRPEYTVEGYGVKVKGDGPYHPSHGFDPDKVFANAGKVKPVSKEDIEAEKERLAKLKAEAEAEKAKKAAETKK